MTKELGSLSVTALRYNKLGSLLAYGSKDNDVILWDVVGWPFTPSRAS